MVWELIENPKNVRVPVDAVPGMDRYDRSYVAKQLRTLAQKYEGALFSALRQERAQDLKPGSMVPKWKDGAPVTEYGAKLVREAATAATSPMLEVVRAAREKVEAHMVDAPSDECLRALTALGLRTGDVDPAELEQLDARWGGNYQAHRVIVARAGKQNLPLYGSWDAAPLVFSDLERSINAASSVPFNAVSWKTSGRSVASFVSMLNSAIDVFEQGETDVRSITAATFGGSGQQEVLGPSSYWVS